MSSLSERVRLLEDDLKASPMRHYIYNDLPFAIFCYEPEQEWEMRAEIGRLKTRIEQETGRQVVLISLAELLWQSVEESEGIEEVAALEQKEGFEEAQRQVQDYLSDPDWRPLCDLLAQQTAVRLH